ncbi:MAG TPA: NAD(P)H-dependent glycerol-3-phosphate dehydrogenase [Vicinamibacterales bacterium]|jgi:glycerol-3-phosphate dehydrogenase (NAD(P)+)|nr:NAD(P)H-dependent glycerol-3-phosphate dehydrogenase [Vicinamibacterales bacterium]
MSATAVLGAGSWGTALAVHLARADHDVRLWARDAAFVSALCSARVNERYLPAVPLPEQVRLTDSLDTAVTGAKFIVVAVPSHGVRAVVDRAAASMGPGTIVVSAAKGIEVDSLQRMSEVIAEASRHRCPVVVLSGPSFAAEVARGLPTAVLAASSNCEAARAVQESFRGRGLRLYVNDDVAGVEIGGALKNVIAIAAGCVEGLGLGHNALAALITRGLAEISRLAMAEGGRRDTLSGLSGLGDLVLTCTGDLSRNRRVGIELGRGRELDEILAGLRMVAEGVNTTRAALALGARHGIELPIAAQMQEVLDGRCSPLNAVEALMLRRQRAEADG